MYCMAKYIGRSRDSDAVIAVGDFNCKEEEVATEIFVEASGLSDRYFIPGIPAFLIVLKVKR